MDHASEIVLAVDPGIRGCGCAVFIGGVLDRAEYVTNTSASGNGVEEWVSMARAILFWKYETTTAACIDTLVLEVPQTYGGRAASGDANDLIPLAGINGVLAGSLYEFSKRIVDYKPHEWKGSIDADAMIERIRGRLRDHEPEHVVLPNAESLQHNVWDAIGIGLKYHGRLERKRAVVRD